MSLESSLTRASLVCGQLRTFCRDTIEVVLIHLFLCWLNRILNFVMRYANIYSLQFSYGYFLDFIY